MSGIELKKAYVKLLKDMRKISQNMGNDAPKIEFNYDRTLKEELTRAARYSPEIIFGRYDVFSIWGANEFGDMRIYYDNDSNALKIVANRGDLSKGTLPLFFGKLFDLAAYPLEISDRHDYRLKK
jgi:hypothetical protein